MSRNLFHRLHKAALVPGLLCLGLGAQGASAAQDFTTTFTQINGVGASGTAQLSLNDAATSLFVRIMATGLEAGGPHLAHIHGRFSNGTTGLPVDSMTPTIAQDSDGDGFVELGEGLTRYGPIIVDFGNIDPDQDGTVDFTRTLDLTDMSNFAGSYTRADLLGADFMSLDLREIVIHGMSVAPGIGAGTPGEVNGTNGYLAVLPVLSGEIQGAVPEPASWALMIIGFGGVGTALRTSRRRRVAAAC